MVKLVEGLNPEMREADHQSNISLSLYDDDQSEFSCADSVDYNPRTSVLKNEKTSPSPDQRKSNQKSPPEGNDSDESVEREPPMLFGSFTNWQGQ